MVRRCGRLEPADFKVWDDDEIVVGGVDRSLCQVLRDSVRSFLELPFIAGLILCMTLFLCVVIFLELSFPDQLVEEDGSRSLIGQIFWVVNYFLLSFFMLEIGMKLFALSLIHI